MDLAKLVKKEKLKTKKDYWSITMITMFTLMLLLIIPFYYNTSKLESNIIKDLEAIFVILGNLFILYIFIKYFFRFKIFELTETTELALQAWQIDGIVVLSEHNTKEFIHNRYITQKVSDDQKMDPHIKILKGCRSNDPKLEFHIPITLP